jgi:hypothetical protein
MRITDINGAIVELKEMSLNFGKSFVAIPADEIDGLGMKELIKKYEDGGYSCNILDNFKLKIENEREALIKDASKFFNTRSTFTSYNSDGLSPNEISEMVIEKMIRIQRLMLVFQPDYYQSLTKKPNGDEYDIVKAHWIDKNGMKFRKVSKTFGLKGKAGLEFSMKKLLRDFFELESITTENQLSEQFINGAIRADYTAQVAGKEWIFEFKLTDKNEFIKTGLRFDLWQWYCEAYY